MPGPKEEIFTEAEQKELEKTAKQYAQQIKEKNHQAKFLKDPKGYLTGKNVTTGEMVESTATPGLQELAIEGGLTLIRGLHLSFINHKGKTTGGQQAELDFVMLGKQTIEKIISAKLNPKRFKATRDRAILRHYTAIPTNIESMREYLKLNFGNTDYSMVEKVNVVINGTHMPLDEFRRKYLSKTIVDSIVVESVAPGPEKQIGNQLRVGKGKLTEKTIDLIKKYL